jgi:hypothetical protein
MSERDLEACRERWRAEGWRTLGRQGRMANSLESCSASVQAENEAAQAGPPHHPTRFTDEVLARPYSRPDARLYIRTYIHRRYVRTYTVRTYAVRTYAVRTYTGLPAQLHQGEKRVDKRVDALSTQDDFVCFQGSKLSLV